MLRLVSDASVGMSPPLSVMCLMCVAQISSVRVRHGRRPLRDSARDGKEGHHSILGDAAAVRDVFAVRRSVDLLHRHAVLLIRLHVLPASVSRR